MSENSILQSAVESELKLNQGYLFFHTFKNGDYFKSSSNNIKQLIEEKNRIAPQAKIYYCLDETNLLVINDITKKPL